MMQFLLASFSAILLLAAPLLASLQKARVTKKSAEPSKPLKRFRDAGESGRHV